MLNGVASCSVRALIRALSALAFIAVLHACSPGQTDPDVLPFRLVERSLIPNSRAIDLDHDGWDELYRIYRPGQASNQNLQALVISSQTTGRNVQANFTGHVDPPLFRDVDGDGDLEALVPVTRNDSLFLSVVESNGEKLSTLFLIDGRPRIEADGVIPWNAALVDARAHDLDGDGARELITVVSAGYARMPRGVLVHRLSDGTRVGQALVGAKINSTIIDDFDGDGRPEVLATSAPTNNGAVAGGFDDSHSYLMVFATWPEPRVTWHRDLGTSGMPFVRIPGSNGDGRQGIMLMVGRRNPGLIEILEAGTWQTLRVREIGFNTAVMSALDLDRDGREEVVVPLPHDEVLLLDDNLEILTRRTLPNGVDWSMALPDLDNDGIPEIAVADSRGGVSLLGPTLKLKAVSTGALPVDSLRSGGRGPSEIIAQGANQETVAWGLTRNRLYYLHRFGPIGAGAGVLIGVPLGFFLLLRARRRTRLLLLLRGAALENSSDGFLLLDRRGRIVWLNATMKGSCVASPADSSEAQSPTDITGLVPALEDFCQQCLNSNSAVGLTMAEPFRAATGEMLKASGEPMLARTRGDPHWLFRVRNGKSSSAELTAAWAPLARRTAHDLRNPLTSILLTLQRLQMEYRAAAPQVAPALDAYTVRLQQRVDQLRRLASNFLKLLGAETPRLERHDINAIVADSVEAIRAGLPPDLKIEARLASNLPCVVVDREQMESVIENLVANSINSMTGGGTITVATQLAHGLHPESEHETDCVQIEVLDTGHGIPAAVLPHVFQPGFSTNEQGSGLGLAIVKKIVNEYGGEVSVTSDVGTGTAFTILLPVLAVAPPYAKV